MFFNFKFIFRLLCFNTFFVGLIRGQSTYCPDPTETLPYCNCSTDTSNRVILDCSLAKDEDQLEDYFTQTVFPNLDVYQLAISFNQDLKYLTRNVFGEVTFQSIYFNNDTIEYINGAVFAKSQLTLSSWIVEKCNLPNVAAFPFSSLNQFTKLNYLKLYSAGVFDVLPTISSNSLSTLQVVLCELQYLPIGVFDNLPKLRSLTLNYNNIISIPPGPFSKNTILYSIYLNDNNIGRVPGETFQNLTNLNYVDLSSNNIDLIEAGTFKDLQNLVSIDFGSNNIGIIEAGTFQNLQKLRTVRLEYNNIDLLKPGAFWNLPSLTNLYLYNNTLQYLLIDGFGYLPALEFLFIYNNNIKIFEFHLFTACCPSLYILSAFNNELTSISEGMFNNGFYSGNIWLYSNQLRTLDENWLGAPLRNLTTVDIKNNPLDCGCDMAWLYAEPTLMNRLTAFCSNGTNIKSLDSLWFSTNC